MAVGDIYAVNVNDSLTVSGHGALSNDPTLFTINLQSDKSHRVIPWV